MTDETIGTTAGAYGSGMHVWSTNVPRLMILLQVSARPGHDAARL